MLVPYAEAGSAVVSLSAVGVTVPGTRIEGAAEVDLAGGAVSGAGDVWQDGFEDIIVTAEDADPLARLNAGEVFVINGRADGVGLSGQLALGGFSSAEGLHVLGAEPGDRMASKVFGAGDVDGNGFSDLLLGASGADRGGLEAAGEAVFLSPADPHLLSPVDLETPPLANTVRFDGVSAHARCGVDVAGVGDINGDGFGDFLVGSPSEPTGMGPGEAYLLFGALSYGTLRDSIDLAAIDIDVGVRFEGAQIDDATGVNVAGAGDVNGDGIGDFLIAAALADPQGRLSAGRVYLLFGSMQFQSAHIDLSETTPEDGIVIDGAAPGDTMGYDVSAAGDVNGDSFGDFILCANRADPSGRLQAGVSYVIFGGPVLMATGGHLDLAALTAEQGVRLEGIGAGDESGHWAGCAGDTDGDGFADVIIGAPYANSARTDAGEAYLVRGAALKDLPGGVLPLSSLDGVNGVRYQGSQTSGIAGRSVAGAGDVNGDGLSDYLVGAMFEDVSGRRDAGRAYLIHGQGTAREALWRSWARAEASSLAGIGMAGDGSHSIPFSRCWMGFDGGKGTGAARASLQAVTLTRTGDEITGLPPDFAPADVVWEVATDRVSHQAVLLAFKWLDDEIEGLDEGFLRLWAAPTPEGPWILVQDAAVQPQCNRVDCTAAPWAESSRFFALASELPGPTGARTTEVVDHLLGLRPYEARYDVDQSGRVNAADVVRNLMR